MTEKKIWVDPGHGHPDPGAVSTCGRYTEAANVLQITRAIHGMEPKLPGVSFGYSRLGNDRLIPNDKALDLQERARRANEWGADIFISIHQNADINQQGRGLETYCYGNMYQASKEGCRLAEAIQGRVLFNTGLLDRGVKRARFLVLVETKMPAVLIEAGFVGGNPAEAHLVSQPEFHHVVARGILQGIADYFHLAFDPPAKWNPQAEVDRLLTDGIINTRREHTQVVNWGEFATVLNRIRGKQ